MSDSKMTDNELEGFIEQIAASNGVSVDDVKKEIEDTISELFKTPNDIANLIPRQGDVPTIKEFIEFTMRMAAAFNND